MSRLSGCTEAHHRHPDTLKFRLSALVFFAGTMTGGVAATLATHLRGRAWPLILGATAAAFIVVVLTVCESRRVSYSIRRFLVVCAYCHKVADDDRNWNTFEAYMLREFRMRSSHGICPDCLAKESSPKDR